jgi:hypothetical protein
MKCEVSTGRMPLDSRNGHGLTTLWALCIDDLEMHDGTSLGRFQTLSFGFRVNAISAEEFGSTSV